MASTYTANTGIELIATGEQSGTWGDTTNTNLQIIDRLTNGVGAISLSGTTHTLTTTDGVLSDGQYKVLVFGGSPSGTNTVTISPNDQDKVYVVKNNSGESVVLTQGSGGNVTIADGNSAIVYADGAGSGAAVVDITSTFGFATLTGTETLTNKTLTSPDVNTPDIDGGTIDGTVIGGSTPAAISGTTGSFSGNLTVDTDTLFVDASTNRVGIGTSSPSQKLQVAGAIVASGAAETFSVDGIYLQNKGSSIFDISAWRSGASASILTFSTDSGSDVASLERMRITNTGNVGIGTSAPETNSRLTVRGTDTNNMVAIGNSLEGLASGTNNGGAIYFGVGTDTAEEPTGGIEASWGGASTPQIHFGLTRGPDAVNKPRYSAFFDGSLRMYTNDNERLRITSTGSVGIGTSSPATKLHVDGDTTFGGAIDETVYTISGTSVSLDPSNGTVQLHTLTGTTTYTDGFSAGQAITLMIDDGSANTVTWPTMTWVNNGGSAPTLATTGYTVVALWKVSTTLYGALVGDGS